MYAKWIEEDGRFAFSGDGDEGDLTAADHAALFVGLSQGKLIVPGANGKPVLADPPAPTQAQIIAQYESALDAHTDGVAKMSRYDSRFTFALRAGFPGPYQSEGMAFAQWMDECNVAAYALLGEVEAGTKPMPTVEAFIAGLPPFEA